MKISEFLSENFQLFGGEIFSLFEEAGFRNDTLLWKREMFGFLFYGLCMYYLLWYVFFSSWCHW